jgi:RNA polymerase sigma factor (sigma-70 family)
VRDGRYDLERGGDLWQLLVTITLHKLHHQVSRATAKKRAVERERSFSTGDGLQGLHTHLATHDPSPVEAVALAELLEQVMHRLDDRERRMVELRLQGYNLEEIAADAHLSRRTVRRTLTEVKQLLEQWQIKDSR